MYNISYLITCDNCYRAAYDIITTLPVTAHLSTVYSSLQLLLYD
jgi:hypothetical protein